MRILYVAHRIPYPPNKGDKIRSFHEIKFLSRNHETHLLAFYDDPADAACAKDLYQYCRSVTLIPLDRRRQAMKAVASMMRGEPWSLGFYRDDEMASAVRRVFEKEGPEVALAYSSSVAPYIEALPIRRILDFVDSDASKWHQYSRVASIPRSWLYIYESARLSAFELRMMRVLDASVFVSRREVSWMKNSGEAADPALALKLHFVPNGIDLDYFQPRCVPPADSRIVFTGAMDYFPNVDAVQFFARSVFPRVRSRVPAASFMIVGSKPLPAVRQLADIEGVAVTGTVPDVRPYLAQSSVAVVPLRISQGIQNKVLEALATGLPVVTTPQVAGGLHAIEQLPVSVETEPQAIADRVVHHLVSPAQTESQIAKTRAVLTQNFSWEATLARLEGLLTPRA